MKVDINKFWIEGVLTEAFPRFLVEKGADLNNDGKINGSEGFRDFNGDGYIGDREDYRIYLSDSENRSLLSTRIPFFQWGKRLSVKNRIHQLLYLFSDVHDGSLIQSAYIFLADLVKGVDEEVGQKKMGPKEESQTYYAVMKKKGIEFKDRSDDDSLVTNIKDGRLDCDTSSAIAIAIGDERGVVLQPVLTFRHQFLRGREEDGREFNIDRGKITSDGDYIVDPRLLVRGVYLKTLNDRGLEAIFLANRGIVLRGLDRNEEALAAYDKALEIKRDYPEVHNGRGVVLGNLGRNEEALAAYDKALEIKRDYPEAHYNRGVVLEGLGRYQEALAAFDKALEIKRDYPEVHNGRGVVLGNLGRNEEALAAYDKALEIKRDYPEAHYNRGVALKGLGRYQEAKKAFQEACRLDPSRCH